jgi:hypothetical protein
LLNKPGAVAVDAAGYLYFTESGNHAVRRIHPSGYVITLAGGGLAGYQDGTNRAVRFSSPGGIALAPDGSVVVADTGNHRLRSLSFVRPVIRPVNTGVLQIEMKPWLTLTGSPGDSYTVQTANGLTGPWTVTTNITLTSSNLSWVDPLAPRGPRYYRARRGPTPN